MFLIRILSLIVLILWPELVYGAEGHEDVYLDLIIENGEVVACPDEQGFNALLEGKLPEELSSFCWFEPVVSVPQFLGWTSIGDFPVRQYQMETEHGLMKFVYPYLLAESDYVYFSGPRDEADTVSLDEPTKVAYRPWGSVREMRAQMRPFHDRNLGKGMRLWPLPEEVHQ